MMYNIIEGSSKMRKEKEVDLLYVKNVIAPLENMIKKLQVSDMVSRTDIRELDKILLEKYLTLEKILEEISSNDISK